jgi:hypothetical protein
MPDRDRTLESSVETAPVRGDPWQGSEARSFITARNLKRE